MNDGYINCIHYERAEFGPQLGIWILKTLVNRTDEGCLAIEACLKRNTESKSTTSLGTSVSPTTKKQTLDFQTLEARQLLAAATMDFTYGQEALPSSDYDRKKLFAAEAEKNKQRWPEQ